MGLFLNVAAIPVLAELLLLLLNGDGSTSLKFRMEGAWTEGLGCLLERESGG